MPGREGELFPAQQLGGVVETIKENFFQSEIAEAGFRSRLKGDAAREGRNLMEPIMQASRACATMGEMCDALRDAWDTWRETPVF